MLATQTQRQQKDITMYKRTSDSDDPSDTLSVEDHILNKWADLMLMYQHNNPHIQMSPEVIYTPHDNGDMTAKLKGTDMSMRIKSGDWSWIE